MRVDVQSHVFPRAYAEVLAQNPRPPRAIRQGDAYQVTYGPVQQFRLDLGAYAVARKLRDMDASDIDISVLSLNMPGPDLLVPALASQGARACNDALAEMVAGHPDRFVALACLPWQDVPAALAELERAAGELDLRGVVLYSHLADGAVDDPRYEPLYARIAELGLPLVLHPIVPPWASHIHDYSMIPMAGLMVDHSFAMLRLILSGIMERHPALIVVQPHCGGVLPYLWGRIEHQTGVMGRGVENISRPVKKYYDRVYLDLVSPSALAMRYAYDFQGPDRLLFGSDHPWVEIGMLLGLIEGLEIPEQDRAKILGGNAQRLFGIA
jgi:predicted TIM-barrel fold metal-dependent hydrolase